MDPANDVLGVDYISGKAPADRVTGHRKSTLIGSLTTSQVLERIKAFDLRYAQDWRAWMRVSGYCDFQGLPIPIEVALEFKRIMGKWQACRPKPLRSAIGLRRTLEFATEPLTLLGPANLRCFQTPGPVLTDAISSVWQIFEDGLCVQGKASEVGVTKAILLVTKGKIGPAFDSNVKVKLNARHVSDSESYLRALAAVAGELVAFEARELRCVEDLALEVGRPAEVGRIVDMVLGPRR